MRKKFESVTEHTKGTIGITQSHCSPAGITNGLYKTRIEEHKEIRAKAEEKVEARIREEKSRENKADEVVSE